MKAVKEKTPATATKKEVNGSINRGGRSSAPIQ
ncbi:hypothetical protein BMS3Abin08_00631 [bacterium BMS3Abin08]|nr:hypothetical protein BMS3Abin08_00631 [bacterium BMS3Abin08]